MWNNRIQVSYYLYDHLQEGYQQCERVYYRSGHCHLTEAYEQCGTTENSSAYVTHSGFSRNYTKSVM